MNNQPANQLVSIGLATFNRASLLKRAVDSLLAQTYSHFELIISDNASTDETEQICREYAQKDGRIRYFRQEKSIGAVAQPDFLISKIKGDYFMFASDDDWWHPDFILRLKETLDQHSEYGLAMSSLRQVCLDGSLINEIRYDGANDLSSFSSGRIFTAVLKKNPPVHFFIMGLFRTEVFKKLLWKPNERVLGSDKILMYEAALFTRFYSLPDILWHRTIHPGPDAEHYGHDYRKVVENRWAYFRHVKVAVSSLFRSPNISLSRKVFLLPPKILEMVWTYKKHLLRELWPGGFRQLKQLLKKG